MDFLPEELKARYAGLAEIRKNMETMKLNQSMRGVEQLKIRTAHRAATHKSWRQMKGLEWALYELNHPGNKPFVIGFG